ncbi:protocatechuate 3,4-dioxygenase subunit beta [Corynebacterium cystitidis]|uniref:Protocatechuate 3,4-dioxygenase, beta subunit n=1 Tax=Corynebacterium cystitidis DSM 20524 TaxID=1121357 RepID=A0A1H9SPN8_9CORY|nr:protocatechuate 3,4-dioxygenase subunit beta [Corynebacterium cystitidis]WJY83124.1 Protocatechuate 3,4-dioxygenase beta chain [Corynebacterium cystitidis DSM 20524]SER86818.1 protocatechuate 3,4-dioxygenase, beta subunit [Corynebacterium cystitidis DSM 20524]SNV66528.1 protocatechuate 3,4-dioxygenase subunit beta [Corynebacterium cystitidis]
MSVEYTASTEGVFAPLHFPEYRTTIKRNPTNELILTPQRLGELSGPVLGERDLGGLDNDMTKANGGEAIGQRMLVHGRVLGWDNKPVPNTLVEVWQANAAGRYRHKNDSWPAPLDPHFNGVARTMTNEDGYYEFLTIMPGMYPWGNHNNAWRPAHIHFSLYGRQFSERLVTQMYFPNDPMFFQDPIYNSVPQGARERMIAVFDYDKTAPNYSLAYKFDIVLRGKNQTFFETHKH